MDNFKHITVAEHKTRRSGMLTFGDSRFAIGQNRHTNKFAVLAKRVKPTDEILSDGSRGSALKTISTIRDGFQTRALAQKWLNENGVNIRHEK